MTGIAGPQSMPVAGRRSLVLRLRLLAFGSAGVSQRRGSRVHEQWAHFRFSVIGQLLAAPPRKGMLRLELDKLAACAWRRPVSGEPVRFGVSTLERWYYRARKERHDPVAVLRRKLRKDAGAQDAMGAAVCQAVLAQYAAHKSWSVKLHHDNVLALAERNPALTPVPSYSTLRRFLAAHGLDKRRRLTSRRTEGAERAEARLLDREVRSYEAEYVNGLWHWDCHVGSRKVLTPRGEWQTPVLFGVLDDRSRLACHLQRYLAENAENVAHGLSQALQKRGLPRAALSDNGAAMTAAEIAEGLARLGIVHETTLPYSPYQNAKQESFWGPVDGRLIAMLEDVPGPAACRGEGAIDLASPYGSARIRHPLRHQQGQIPLSAWTFDPPPQHSALSIPFLLIPYQSRNAVACERPLCAKTGLSGRKPTWISLDCPHEEDRLSLVRALDALVAITDPLGWGHTPAIHRPGRCRRRIRRGRSLFSGPSLRTPTRLAFSLAGGRRCEDQPHRDRHGGDRHALREPAVHGRGRRSSRSDRGRTASARHQQRVARAGDRWLAIFRLSTGRRPE
jgi:transposase InsO family protein